MQCNSCGSKWESKNIVSNCPFCGNLLVVESLDNMTVASALRKIIDNSGIEILNNSRMIISLIADYVVGFDKEKKLLKIASANGVLTSIIKISQETNSEQQQVLVQKTKKILTDDAFLSEENAILILNILLEAINVKKIEAQKQENVTPSATNISIIPTVVSQIVDSIAPTKNISIDDKMSELVKKNERLSKQDGEDMLAYGKMLLSNGEKDKGIKFIRFAAQHGCLNAAVTLGDCYETGNGVTRDIKIAEAYYRQAAVSGIEEGRRKLNGLSGQLYKKTTTSRPVQANTNTINQQQKQSSLFGSLKNKFLSNRASVENKMNDIIANKARLSKEDAEDMLYLGKQLLDEGNKDKAIKFIKYAAQHGNSDAAVQMGICYETGNGVVKDRQIALAYYRQAANSGNAEGKRRLRLV